MNDRISGIVRSCVADVAQRAIETIGSETLLVEDLCIDSLNAVDLILLLEERTGCVGLPLVDWFERRSANSQSLSVGQLSTVVAAHLAGKRHTA